MCVKIHIEIQSAPNIYQYDFRFSMASISIKIVTGIIDMRNPVALFCLVANHTAKLVTKKYTPKKDATIGIWSLLRIKKVAIIPIKAKRRFGSEKNEYDFSR